MNCWLGGGTFTLSEDLLTIVKFVRLKYILLLLLKLFDNY